MWENLIGVMLDVLKRAPVVRGQRFAVRKRGGLSGSNYPDVPLLPPTAPDQK